MADDFGRQLADLLYGSEPTPESPQDQRRISQLFDRERLRRLAGAGEAAATIGTGLLSSIPAGYAGLSALMPTRAGSQGDLRKAAKRIQDVQGALTFVPRTEYGTEYLEGFAKAVEPLSIPAKYIGDITQRVTGSPTAAGVAETLADPINLVGTGIPSQMMKTGIRAAKAAPRVAGEVVGNILTPTPRTQAQRGAIDLGPQIPEFQPQSSAGLVSRTDEALASLPRQRGTGAEFLRELQKTPGVKPAELEERGLIDALSGMGKVTKADVLKVLQDNPPVKFEEVVLGQGRVKTFEEWAKDKGLTPEAIQDFGPSLRNSYEAFKEAEGARVGGTKYGQYTLPGGENYREILLTLPSKRPSIKTMGRREYDEAVRRADEQGIQDYTTPHWEQPNVLAHARISDRTGPSGEKILHVEEVQSDWHQTGRKSGYKTAEDEDKLRQIRQQYKIDKALQKDFYKTADEYPEGSPRRLEYVELGNKITPRLMKMDSEISRLNQVISEGVPDAPFKKNWHELMMRRLVDYAAKNGYDRIAITPGAEQASRYDLSKQVNSISWQKNRDGTYSIEADAGRGEPIIRKNLSESALADTIGKEVAQKIVDGVGKFEGDKAPVPRGQLTGIDLQVGGEGMKGFYDKILPTYLNELGKPYGVKVGQMDLSYTPTAKQAQQGAADEALLSELGVEVPKAKRPMLHTFDITPQMREAIKSKGLPLYKKGGAVRKADGGEVTEPDMTDGGKVIDGGDFRKGGKVRITDNPDTMQLELAAGGGVGEERDWRSKIAGGGIRGAITRGFLGIDPSEDMTPTEREFYENTARASAPALGLAAAPAVIVKGAKGTKAAKAAQEAEELKVPYNIPRAPAKTREEIRPIAQRMAEQLTGEFVRPKEEKSINPAGKSLRQFLQEKEFEKDYITRKTKDVPEPAFADIEKQQGMVKLGISGDTTMADTELLRAGPYSLETPVPLHGGPRFPLGGEGAWASNNPQAANVQKRVGEISEYFGGAPVLGQYVAMGPAGSSFAQHLADANLRAINLSGMNKRQIEEFNNRIRRGNKESGPRPSFPGIQDKDEAYLWFAFDPKLRIHFNDLMQKISVTKPLNLPDGRVILDAVTEPQLRNKEIMTSGFSQFQMDPSIRPENIPLSMHPTYTHLIPMKKDAPVTQTRYPIPAELEFPDVTKFIRENYRPAEFTGTFQKASPRQLIDPQAIAEIKMFEELMKEYTGKKKGGAVKKQAGGAIKAALAAAREKAALMAKARKELEMEQASKEYFERPAGYGSQEKVNERAALIKAKESGVLPAAERDANLAKMLEASQVKSPLYHSSRSPDINTFYSWSHLGTKKAAEDRARQIMQTNPEGVTTYPVHALVKNPLRTEDLGLNQMGFWNLEKLIDNLDPRKVDFSKWSGGKKGLKADYATDQDPSIVEDFLRRNGYDSIVYRNQAEDPGSDSYIIFNPKNIKSATGNRGTFDVTRPEITKKRGGKVSITNNLDTMRLAVQKRK